MTDSNWDFETDRDSGKVPATSPEQPTFAAPGGSAGQEFSSSQQVPVHRPRGTNPVAGAPSLLRRPTAPTAPSGRTVFPPTASVPQATAAETEPTGVYPAALPTPPLSPRRVMGNQSAPTFTPPATSPPQMPPTMAQSSALRQAEATAARDKKRRRWGLPALVAFLAGALISGAAFTAGTLVTEDNAPVAAPVTTPVTVPANTSGPSLVPTEGENPAAFVAATLGPSVVQIRTDIGAGSGVVYKDGGFIMTNNHVIDGYTEVLVIDSQGRTLNGTVVGSDPRADIAVVQVDGLNLPVASLAVQSELTVGQTAIAIGSPFDLSRSVTSGIISALNRPLPNQNGTYTAMIQTDAPINPGNSGGPLANRLGEVIGINTAIRTDGLSNSNVGVGFAVPIDIANRVAERITSGKSLDPGFLGVGQGQAAIGEIGVVIAQISENSAAERAGLQDGDRVLTVNDAPVTDFAELAGLITNNFPGDEITLEIVRGEEPMTVTATLGER
ncbi:MAG: PDZ domain-containing protein [Acidimicrobiales bacterium]|nr:PDZ domain-containing protein [Acidimicrobiales bacterium]